MLDPKNRAGALSLELGLGQTDGALALFPLAAILHDLNAFETLEDGKLAANGTRGLEGRVLRQNVVIETSCFCTMVSASGR